MEQTAEDLGDVTDGVFNGSEAFETMFSKGQLPPKHAMIMVRSKTETPSRHYLVKEGGMLEYCPVGDEDTRPHTLNAKHALSEESAPKGWTVFIDSDYQ